MSCSQPARSSQSQSIASNSSTTSKTAIRWLRIWAKLLTITRCNFLNTIRFLVARVGATGANCSQSKSWMSINNDWSKPRSAVTTNKSSRCFFPSVWTRCKSRQNWGRIWFTRSSATMCSCWTQGPRTSSCLNCYPSRTKDWDMLFSLWLALSPALWKVWNTCSQMIRWSSCLSLKSLSRWRQTKMAVWIRGSSLPSYRKFRSNQTLSRF